MTEIWSGEMTFKKKWLPQSLNRNIVEVFGGKFFPIKIFHYEIEANLNSLNYQPYGHFRFPSA